MEYIQFFIDLLTNTKEVLLALFQQYGTYIYAILFLIIFVETGLVIFPLLPGDSLLFTAGLLCAQPSGLDIWFLIPLLIFAAVLGDNVNYFVGKYFSEKVLSWKINGKPLVKQEWLDKTHEFFEKNGTKTIILARFVPIVRTVTPFVSGIGRMNYRVFLPFDILGGVIWVGSITTIGYFLGQVPFVEKHLEKFILGIVLLSVMPIFWQAIKQRLNAKNA
ncbi:MAG: VTT domain-containing protein [Chitinophagales bacterium]|nr:VTT domain-containing protein [Chitinophagales bacterium]MDW8419820.1 VTT domain-containing protein [Chitinophagales bacterium]